MIVVQPFRKRSEQAVSVLSAENPEFVQRPCFAWQNPPIFHILDCFNIVFLKAELPCIGMARCKGCKNVRTLFGFQIQAVVDRIKTFAEHRFRDLKKLIVTSIFANHARRLQRSRVLGEHLKALDGISFDLSGGEILGVAGIAGSGQKELCESIAGLDKVASGDIIFKGDSIVKLNPRDIIRRGITMSFVPEDRLGMGLVGSMSIIDNVLLKSYQNMPGIFVNRTEGRRIADDIIERFEISTPSPYHAVKKLSGGNIQKVLIGREVNLNPELLITAYPVRGLDIGASYNIYDVLNEQKKKGVGILFIGEDLDVLLGLSDRIMVLHEGRIMGIVDAKTATKEQIGLLMLGHTAEEKDA